MKTMISFITLLIIGFHACFTATTNASTDIQAKLNRTFASDAIQTEDEQSVQLSDSEYDDGDDAVELFREDLFEGDIVLTNNSYIVFNRNESITRQVVGRKSGNGSKVKVSEVQVRNAVRQKTLLWPNARVPYVISPEYDNISKQIIMDAFQEYRLLTCVQFVPKTQSDSNYIYIAPYDGCYSTVGNNGGRQIVSLGEGCLKKGIVIHELMHVIGFFHEQNRADRDLYVSILWENVKPSLAGQFNKYSPNVIDNLGLPYDYDSVTHYPTSAFSRNGKPTIVPKSLNEVIKIGQRRGLSLNDIKKINKLYSCLQQVTTAATATSTSKDATNVESVEKHEGPSLSSTIGERLPTTPSTEASLTSTTHETIQKYQINLSLRGHI